jgi:hypothetical protein
MRPVSLTLDSRPSLRIYLSRKPLVGVAKTSPLCPALCALPKRRGPGKWSSAMVVDGGDSHSGLSVGATGGSGGSPDAVHGLPGGSGGVLLGGWFPSSTTTHSQPLGRHGGIPVRGGKPEEHIADRTGGPLAAPRGPNALRGEFPSHLTHRHPVGIRHVSRHEIHASTRFCFSQSTRRIAHKVASR